MDILMFFYNTCGPHSCHRYRLDIRYILSCDSKTGPKKYIFSLRITEL